jgi:nuclear RNA export factor
LLKVNDPLRRNKLLRQGRLAITSFLTGLPKSSHDMNSLTLDVPFATDRIMTFTVTGIFKERKVNQTINMPIRHFNRMFVVVPQNSGFCIVNETIFITTPTQFQIAVTSSFFCAQFVLLSFLLYVERVSSSTSRPGPAAR